jgi:broad specificity phosphatase PhoE
VRAVRDRLVSAVEEICHGHPHAHVAIVSHGFALAVVWVHYQGMPLLTVWDHIPSNDEWRVLEINNL